MRRLQTKFISDISRYTENFFLGMSPRQTFFGLAGGACMVAGPLLFPGADAASMLAGLVLIALGFFRPDGLPPEKYLKAWVESHFVNPSRRCYQQDNTAYEFLWEGRIGGRICFRPQDYLKEDKELPRRKLTEEPGSAFDADWPEAEVPAAAADAKESAPADEEPKSKAKPKARKTPAKKPAAKKTAAAPVPDPAELLARREKTRVPVYGAGRSRQRGGGK